MEHSLAKVVNKFVVIGLAAVLLLGLLTAISRATDVTLTDQNSQLTIDPLSLKGMYSWAVDGRSYDSKQWFWYRIGTSEPESSLDTLSLSSSSSLGPNNETLNYGGGNNRLGITLVTSLIGADAGTGQSDIEELIRLTNKTSSQMDLYFFQYNNFILSDPHQDTVVFDNNNHVVQTGPHDVLQENFLSGEAVVTGSPTHEAAIVDPLDPNSTLNKLIDGSATNLNGNSTAGPGDVSWAFEWHLSIAAGKTVSISKDKLLNVPEPSSILLLSIFGACLAIGWWNRKRAA